MTTPPKLDSYLSALDKALGPISTGDRAEIVTEIKSHVLEAQARDEQQSIDSILASLGEPEQVATKYLLDRGLKPVKQARRPIVKYLVVGFLGTVFLFFGFVTVLIFKFSPILQVDASGERVRILGGLIDVDGKMGTVKLGDSHIRGEHAKIISGSKKIDPSKTKEINVPFTNGKFTLSNSAGDNFSWQCKLQSEDPETRLVVEENDLIKMNLEKTAASQCDLQIPPNAHLKITGDSAKITVEKPAYNLEVKANNGKIEINPDQTKHYNFDIKTLNGKIDQFENSEAKDAYKISINLVNGVVSRE